MDILLLLPGFQKRPLFDGMNDILFVTPCSCERVLSSKTIIVIDELELFLTNEYLQEQLFGYLELPNRVILQARSFETQVELLWMRLLPFTTREFQILDYRETFILSHRIQIPSFLGIDFVKRRYLHERRFGQEVRVLCQLPKFIWEREISRMTTLIIDQNPYDLNIKKILSILLFDLYLRFSLYFVDSDSVDWKSVWKESLDLKGLSSRKYSSKSAI